MFDPRQELSSLRTPTAEVRNMASHACITSLEMSESITLTCTWTKLYQFQNRNDITMTWFRNSFSVFKKSMCEKFKYVCCALPDYHLLFSKDISAECCNPGCLAPLENLVGVHFILKHLCWWILEQWQRMPIGYACIASCDQSYKSYMDIHLHGCYNMCS